MLQQTWEQRELGEITERYDNLRVPITASLRIPGNTPYYGANGIQDYVEGHTHEGEFVLVAEDGANDLKNYPVQFVNGRIWVNNHAHVLQGKKDIIYNHFLAYAIKRTDMGSLLVGGSRSKLNAETLMKIAISVPEIEEQRVVGTQLNQFDNLITLHQRKLEHLKLKKKSLLQKLFPKEGEVYPELRFPGFTDPWEQRKLGELANNVTEKNVTLSETETFTNSAELGIISQNSFFDRNITNEDNIDNYYIIQPEDFVYNPRISVTAPVGPINRNKLGRTGIISPLYTVFRPHDINTRYLEYFFKTSKWHSYMRFNGDSGARSDRFSIKLKLFYTMPIPVPSLEEQTEIGLLLERFTESITLHQRKLEHLQLLKKALLQQLFV